MRGKSLMIQGTASSVGKSVLCAALLRIFRQDGLEMGRAQAMQAQAAGIEPDVRMNPVLLKPTGDRRSQVILDGKAVGSLSAMEFHRRKGELRGHIRSVYDSLEREVDCVVIEGAGSPAEINLRESDIVNMAMAKAADAPVILVGDINPGGVFAAGNHEYCKMVGDGKVEDEAYKAESRARVQSAYPGNLLFASRVVNGVNFVSFDNIYYYVPAGVPEMFEAEAARGLPVVLCCHVPFYTPEIYEAVTRGDVTRAPYLCGTPDEIVDQVKDQYRRRQQRADARTHEFVARLRGEKLVKAVLCGHLHWPHVSDFAPGVPQYCVGANFKMQAFEIEFS